MNKDISVSKKFKLDPLLPQFTDLNMYYKNSGYDCGHQMDAFDCGYNLTAMAESFYYSNITPQLPALKRGNWKSLEEYNRKLIKEYDSVLVWCGSLSLENRPIGIVVVLYYCWNIIYVKKSLLQGIYFNKELTTRKMQIVSTY